MSHTESAQTNIVGLADLKHLLLDCINANLPAIIYGPPGVGKSELVKQIAAEHFDGNLIDLRLSQFDQVDLRGIPAVIDGCTVWNPPAEYPTTGKGILFLDELHDASPDVLNVCKQLLLDRQIGAYKLPADWKILAATNRAEDKAGASSGKNTANNSRLAHYTVAVSVDDWTQWAATHNIRPEVIAFIRFRKELLHQFDPKAAEPAYPCPRSWSFISRMLDTSTAPERLQHTLFSGIVGSGAASEFCGFLRIWQTMPNLDAIMLDPDNAPLVKHDDLATRYAVAIGLAAKTSPKSYGNATKYLDRLKDSHGNPCPEYGVLMTDIAIKRTPAICTSPDFAAWAAKNGKYYC